MKKKIKVLSVIGTRPEAIKMAPVIKELNKYPNDIESVVVSTAQHREMLDQILKVFNIEPDIDLNIMRPNQTLSQITSDVLHGMEKVLREVEPDIMSVQGDTTTIFASSLAAFYCKVPVGHVEAGLRSYDKFNPYPEELNRRLADVLTDYFFAPTDMAKNNLQKEGVPGERIFVTGNTVVDALLYALEVPYELNINGLDELMLKESRILLVTAHRRENWDQPLANICEAFKELVQRYPDLRIVYPVHLNPNVRRTVHTLLNGIQRIHLIEPVDYLAFIHLMKHSHLILTDSGGIQEEAPSLGKPVLVMRKLTERPEAYHAGVAKIVGTEKDSIIREVSLLLDNDEEYRKMSRMVNPYGDGKSAKRIVDVIMQIRR